MEHPRVQFEKEIESSPVPVFLRSGKEWFAEFRARRNTEYTGPRHFNGLYYDVHGPCTGEFPQRFIVVNRTRSTVCRLWTLQHELGHHACATASCPCWRRPAEATTEVHANLYALCRCVERDYDRALIFGMKHLVLARHGFDPMRRSIAHAVIGTEIWRECRYLAGDQFARWCYAFGFMRDQASDRAVISWADPSSLLEGQHTLRSAVNATFPI